jgi:hypothetical protein
MQMKWWRNSLHHFLHHICYCCVWLFSPMVCCNERFGLYRWWPFMWWLWWSSYQTLIQLYYEHDNWVIYISHFATINMSAYNIACANTLLINIHHQCKGNDDVTACFLHHICYCCVWLFSPMVCCNERFGLYKWWPFMWRLWWSSYQTLIQLY